MFETLGMLRQGGWIMIPIGCCSLAGLTIVIERFVALRRDLVFDPGIVALIDRFPEGSTPDSALQACRRARGTFARIIEALIGARQLSHAQILETLEATGRRQIGALERGLTVLEIIANTTPLLGLLGTVLGMVNVFTAITVEGIGNPRVLSDGISKALITTVAGLVVAIPAVACHSWLTRQVDDYAAELHDRATSFISKLHLLQRKSSDTRPD